MIPMAAGGAIKGKVIRIISPQAVIVDIGTKEGIGTGMKLVIYEEGQTIYGLDGEDLGKVEYVKATVRVVHAQEKFSIAENVETAKITSISGSIASSLTYKEDLAVPAKQIEPLTEYDKTIKKGDLVRTI
jgi:hypothetical protein